jgi:hypothetical protein
MSPAYAAGEWITLDVCRLEDWKRVLSSDRAGAVVSIEDLHAEDSLAEPGNVERRGAISLRGLAKDEEVAGRSRVSFAAL